MSGDGGTETGLDPAEPARPVTWSLVRAPGHESTGAWHVVVDGTVVGLVDVTPSWSGRTRRYAARTPLLTALGPACRTRQQALLVVVGAWQRSRS